MPVRPLDHVVTATRYEYLLVANNDTAMYEIYSPDHKELYSNRDEDQCLTRLMSITGIPAIDKDIIEKWMTEENRMYISTISPRRPDSISTEKHTVTVTPEGHVLLGDKRIETIEDAEKVMATIISGLCRIVY